MFQNTGERYEQASLEKNKLECCWFLFVGGFFFNFFTMENISIASMCLPYAFQMFAATGVQTGLLALVALTAFKNKCPDCQICFCHWRTSVHVQPAVHRFCEGAGVMGRHQSSLRVCDGKAKSIVSQDGTHTLSALNSVSFLYDLLSVLQCIR